MNNPVLSLLNARANGPSGMNNPAQILSEFNKFKKQLAGQNPQAIVQELLNSGKMSPQQFEQLKQQARALQGLLK